MAEADQTPQIEVESSSSSVPAPPSSSTSSKQTPSAASFRAWAPLYLSRTDKTLDLFSRMLSTPSGTDTLLLLLGYSSLLTSRILHRISLARIQKLSELLIKRATDLPPNTTVYISVSNAKIPTSKLLVLAARLKALSSVISDFRIFARLWGLVGIYQWGKGVWNTPPTDRVEERLVKAQVVVNFFFQVLENGAYLASKNVLNWSAEKQNKAWLWSSRFWASHVLLEFLRLGRAYSLQSSKTRAKALSKEKGTELEVRDANAAEWEWRKEWMKSALVNSAWAPLTLHWSTDGGLISDAWVGFFGSVAGVVGVGRLLKRSA